MLHLLFIRERMTAGLVKQGKTLAEARDIVSGVGDDFLNASLADVGLTPPTGGFLAWLVANLPAIIALITQLITLFGGS